MGIGQKGAVQRHIQRLFSVGTVSGLTEGQLLERFITHRDEAAFEALVTRHGPMVLGVCRQVLNDPHDVEDAFQATFLILVRKAKTLRQRDLVGHWLYGVAYRVAARSRVDAARRHVRERSGTKEQAVEPAREDEVGPVLHEELHRLPEKYLAPIALCYLEGQTHEAAAQALGWPVGTVKGRLARARDLLRSRLTRRGVGLSTAILTANLARVTSAAVPPALFDSTVKAAMLVAAGNAAAAGAISASVATLMQGVLRTMFVWKLKLACAVIVMAGVAATGALAYQGEGKPGPDGAQAAPKSVPEGSAPKGVARSDKPDVPAGLSATAQLARERVRHAREGLRLAAPPEKRGHHSFSDGKIYLWSLRVAEAERDASANPADQIAAFQAHLDRMKDFEKEAKEMLDQGMISNLEYLDVQFRREEAEDLLAHAKAGQRAEPTANPARSAPADPDQAPQRDEPAQAEGVGLFSEVEGQTRIIQVLPKGTQVHKGDIVAKLDPAAPRDRLTNQEIEVRRAETDYFRAKITNATAEMAVTEFENGITKPEYVLLLQLTLAEENLTRAAAELAATVDLMDKNDPGRKRAASAVIRAKTALENARKPLTSMRAKKEYVTFSKEYQSVQSEVAKTRSDELAKQATWDLEKSQEHRFRTQVEEKCTLRAPVDGTIVYAHREGEIVREGELIVRIMPEKQ
jgi:RNA polymerase sigma factor (sigma-70 family)